MTVAELLAEARAGLDRLAAEDLPSAVRDGAVVVDIRPAAQRAEEGELDGALVIERNVLEWRCDPSSDARTEEAVDHDVAWVVVCSEGYTSSLAAFALKRLGLHRATDLVGGYQALRRASINLH
ncbi:MAG: rhodanese-like domain-containing protein [Mycobacteriaceae bacterium]